MPEVKSAADAFELVVDAAAKAAARSIDEEGVERLRAQLTPIFDDRLKTAGAWQEAGNAVLTAARQMGVIANAIASLKREPTITAPVLEEAFFIARKHCNVTPKEGQWCTK